MSKQHYVVDCYTCQHNGQETCKGCRTLLVGEDEPYENWQLREDLETKDKKISDLEAKLAESEEKCEELKQAISKCTDKLPPNVAFDIANDDIRYKIVCNLTDRNQEHRNTIKELKQQLSEKEKEIEELKNIHIYDKTIEIFSKGLAQKNQDKISFAVEQLRQFKNELVNKVSPVNLSYTEYVQEVFNKIDNRIKQLKEMK